MKVWKMKLATSRPLEVLFLVVAVIFVLGLFNRFVILDARLGPPPYKLDSRDVDAEAQENTGPDGLDGCYHVYLDVGSNIGIQVRKLFQPSTYPGANVLPVFDKYFGPIDPQSAKRNGQTVCAVGFEPNPHHTATLNAISKSYAECGWQAYFFTETAASHDDGNITFITDNDTGNKEWGGSIVADERQAKGSSVGQVKKMRLANYILDKVVKRKIPAKTGPEPPSIVMKIDIEGSELEVITDLIITGALQHVNFTFAEFHPLSFSPSEQRSQRLKDLQFVSKWLSDVSSQFKLLSRVHVDTMDDESFYTSNFPLPSCKSRKNSAK